MSLPWKTISPLLAIVALSLIAPHLKADPITLFTTGVDNSGSKLAAGAIDQHYKLVTSGGTGNLFVATAFPGTWAGHGAASQWLSPNISANTEYPAQGAQYVFRTTFTIGAGSDLSSASIKGSLYVDDRVQIRLNGVLITELPTTPGSGYLPGSLATFLIDKGFVLGENTLDFVVINTTVGNTPIGLQVTGLSGNVNRVDAGVPEPATLLLLGTGLVGLVTKARRRKKKNAPASRS